MKKLLNSGENLPDNLSSFSRKQSHIYELSKDTIKKLKNKDINNENKVKMLNIYNRLFEYQKIVNKIESSLKSISNFKIDIERYLADNYPYCAEYLKLELSTILDSIKNEELIDNDYSKKKMDKLIGIESKLESKLKVFLTKTAKINAIVLHNNNFNQKVDELKEKYSEYNRKKTILSGALVGKRYDSLVNFDFDQMILKMHIAITKSFDDLQKGNYDSSITNYGIFITSLTVLSSAFSAVDSLLSDHDKSMKFIQLNRDKIDTLVSHIEAKINKSGVSYYHKSSFAEIKNEIIRFRIVVKHDIISASMLLDKIFKKLNEVDNEIKQDISSYNDSTHKSNRSSDTSYGSSSHSSSNSSFGFGGGSFGGGGVRGGW